ncbi:uncharacterized protein LOC119930888 isoform X2 [Tachyglossus aculeatus]|uniref:uncharacterized protein LOC119930888 isoform X2 n=1 Tax=Tachyglossus aculeatus TaxID=9261 RepID=UPI0018F35585|nr:uncharacterized protein LOC119930888 isoform X2 [Tachyglossus aculeatus]
MGWMPGSPGPNAVKKRRRPERGLSRQIPDLHDPVDSDKSTDFVERLAHKYQRKCKVESSTESESETNSEGLTSPVTQGSKKASNMKFQGDHKKNHMEFAEGIRREFLDPYDGDSEDTPNHSDYSLNDCILGDITCGRISPSLISDDPSEVESGGSICSKNLELPAKPTTWDFPASETNDVYMEPMSDVKIPMETTSQETTESSGRLLEASELSVDWELVPETLGQKSDRCLLRSADPPKSARPTENTPRAPLQSSRPCMWEKDSRVYKQPLFKRKMEFFLPECERMKRKK